MTLEDFFTLTEMKDGLTSPSRVKQLVDVMQKEKHNIVNNVGEVTRQWSTVASTIAATENKDCLDLFLQSDGLGYFDSWLKDAQNFGNETGDSFVEESISALLGAIEKLHKGDQQFDTGIFITVKGLLSHNSCRVQERAKALYDTWKQNSESNVVPQDNEKVETVREDQPNASANPVSEHEHLEGSTPGISPPEGDTNGGGDDEKNVGTARDEMMPTICSETVQPEEVEDQNIQAPDVILDDTSMQNGAPDSECSSGMLNLVSENHSIPETAQTQQLEVAMGTGGSEVLKQGIVEELLDVANSSECNLTKQTQQIRVSDKLDAMESSFSVDSTNAQESAKIDPDVVKDVVEEAHPEVFPPGDVKPVVPVGIVGTGDKNSQSPCRDILVPDDTGQIEDCSTDFLHNSYISDHKTGKSKNSFTCLSRVEESGVSEGSSKHDDTDDELGNDSDVSTLAFNARKPSVIERSDIELYGGFDPLEVARQVAIEVERELDCREPSSSSSERISGRGIRRPGSPDSIIRKKDRVIQDPSKDVQTGPSISAVVEDAAFVTTENLIAEQEACLPDMDASQVPVTSQTSEATIDKANCSFDLNDEVLPDEMDHQINPIATPISVVSASRAAAASELPVSPLQFEGALGWKGSAETSAFRPAPPRRNSEAAKPFFATGSNNSLQQRQYFEIDLNVAESEDDKIADLMLGKGSGASVGPSIGETSALGPERSSRLELDLNCISDGGDLPSHWRKEGQVLAPRNGHQSPSHSSSSSSMQHTLRNFDLNDQPPPFSDFSDPVNFGKSSQNSCPPGGSRTDETVISIMGARVEVNRKEFLPRTFPVANGRISNHALDACSTRTGSVMGLGSTFPTHSNAYGHNNPSLGSNIPFSSAMYGLGGPIPYMMDSRGSPVVPQIIGSALSALPTGFSQPPFIMNMTGEPSGSNGAVPLRHNFDLNSGMMADGGRNTGGLRQFLNSGSGRSIDDYMWPNSQSTSSSSGVGGKRKETDGGWEPYPFNYKHHQPPWK